MRALRIVSLFLRDSAWTAFVVMAASLAPLACMLLLDGGSLAVDWPYFLFLSLFLLFVLFAVHLARSWGFYSEAERAIRESNPIEWRRLGGSIPVERWARMAASRTEEACSREAHRLADERSERDALVLSWVHHAKTPIAVIRLISESRGADADMERLGSAARELDRSLDSLIQVVRVDSPETDLRIGKVDVAHLARNAVNGVRDLFIEREVFPSLSVDGDALAYGDEKLISIILDQFLTNAAKYSPRSSYVFVSIASSCDGESIEVSIEDEGCGISPEDVGRVFRPFFTGANGRRGEASTGIGLFLAKKAADAMGAELSLSQRDGGGTAARLLLPAANAPQR